MEPVDNSLEGLPDGTNAFKINFDDLEFGPLIGTGGYGKIYKGEYFGTPIGIKEISLSPKDSKYKELIKFIQREVAMLRFSHPHLVQFIGVSEKGSTLYIITEFVVGGDLAYYLFKNKNDESNNLESFIHRKVNIGSSLSDSIDTNSNSSNVIQEKLINLSWPLRVKIAFDVSCAMAYLHSRNVIHRDLKSTNLLVGDGWKIKVCDFGFARTTYSGRAKRTMTICGSSQYISPEVMLGHDYNETCDVFSYGIVLLEIITRMETTSQLRPSSLKYGLDVDTLLPLIPKDCPPPLLKLALDCCEYDSDKRPTFKEITERLKSLTKKISLSSHNSNINNNNNSLPPLRTLVQSPQPSPIHSPLTSKANINTLNLNGNHIINNSRFDQSSSNDESDFDESDLESDDDTDSNYTNSRPNSSLSNNGSSSGGHQKMGYIIKHLHDSNFEVLLSPPRSSTPLLNLNSKSPTPIILSKENGSPSSSKQQPNNLQEDKSNNDQNLFSPISLLPTFTNIISTNSITSITANITNNLLISSQQSSNLLPNSSTNIQISTNSSFTPFNSGLTRTVQS